MVDLVQIVAAAGHALAPSSRPYFAAAIKNMLGRFKFTRVLVPDIDEVLPVDATPATELFICWIRAAEEGDLETCMRIERELAAFGVRRAAMDSLQGLSGCIEALQNARLQNMSLAGRAH